MGPGQRYCLTRLPKRSTLRGYRSIGRLFLDLCRNFELRRQSTELSLCRVKTLLDGRSLRYVFALPDHAVERYNAVDCSWIYVAVPSWATRLHVAGHLAIVDVL